MSKNECFYKRAKTSRLFVLSTLNTLDIFSYNYKGIYECVAIGAISSYDTFDILLRKIGSKVPFLAKTTNSWQGTVYFDYKCLLWYVDPSCYVFLHTINMIIYEKLYALNNSSILFIWGPVIQSSKAQFFELTL